MVSDNLLTNRTFSWFDVEEPHAEDFDILSNKFNLPYLLVQDTLKPEHLPKYELTEDDDHFLMMRSYDPDSEKEATTVQEMTRKIALFITSDRLVTIHRVHLDFLARVMDRSKKNDAPKSIQALVHQIILGTIRTYEEPVNNLLNQYDDFEEDVLSKKSEQLHTTRMYHFRRQLFVIKRILKQTNDALYRSKDFWEEHPSMLQDLKENIDQIYFQLDEISDNFEHLFQLHFALNDQRANEVMKILTVFSSILLPLNFIASFYGMNFIHIPGLSSASAFSWIVFMMVVVSLTLVWFFKRKGWFKAPKE
ncbi:MAG: CorA family divalent cation transporter [Bacteriovoracia bacterium]